MVVLWFSEGGLVVLRFSDGGLVVLRFWGMDYRSGGFMVGWVEDLVVQ